MVECGDKVNKWVNEVKAFKFYSGYKGRVRLKIRVKVRVSSN